LGAQKTCNLSGYNVGNVRPIHVTSETQCPVAEWLDPTAKEPGKLLTPCPADELIAYPVNPIVNNARNQGPECIQPLKQGELF
jgi:putative SOS response-associated peptidase YedK